MPDSVAPSAGHDPVVSAIGLKPKDAIAYFRQKESVTSDRWTDLWHEAHARAFTISGATSEALLKDIRSALDKRWSEGATVKDFRRELEDIMNRRGWDGGQSRRPTPGYVTAAEHALQDAKTPTEQSAARAALTAARERARDAHIGWRASIIYETNMSTAFSAGRYRRMTTPEALRMFPYWRYRHHACQHPRVQHEAWDGMILRADDPWWDTHFPPNGWRCHCTVEVVSEPMLARNGWVVSDSPVVQTRAWVNPHTGVVEQVPVGIDPGFAYNPGKAWASNEALRSSTAQSRFRADDAGPARPAPSVAPRQDTTGQSAPHPMAPPAPPAPEIAQPRPLPDETRKRAQAEAARIQHRTPRGSVEVGTMQPEAVTALGARTPHVLLSADTMEKQAHRHPELGADEYARLPDILGAPHIIAQDGDRRVVFFRRDGRDYRAAIKTTGDGAENYLVSFHRTDLDRMRRALKRMEIVRGSLDDLAGAAITEDEAGDDGE